MICFACVCLCLCVGLPRHFAHTATFQQQKDQPTSRQIVTPVATMNNQHNQQPSILSTASFYPAGSQPNNEPKYGTTSQNLVNETSLSVPSYNQATQSTTRNMTQSSFDTNEQLPTYTARHGDHILTAM